MCQHYFKVLVVVDGCRILNILECIPTHDQLVETIQSPVNPFSNNYRDAMRIWSHGLPYNRLSLHGLFRSFEVQSPPRQCNGPSWRHRQQAKTPIMAPGKIQQSL